MGNLFSKKKSQNLQQVEGGGAKDGTPPVEGRKLTKLPDDAPVVSAGEAAPAGDAAPEAGDSQAAVADTPPASSSKSGKVSDVYGVLMRKGRGCRSQIDAEIPFCLIYIVYKFRQTLNMLGIVLLTLIFDIGHLLLSIICVLIIIFVIVVIRNPFVQSY